MNLIEIVADVLGLVGSPSADHDRSIVGESPMERGIRRFWKVVVIVLVAAVVAFAAISTYRRDADAQRRLTLPPSVEAPAADARAVVR